eukprot:CAMPEP_0169113974 /NCGR_PEP_ID=MMETSP1015-20121227/28496_1 /TAXON_ID=342587 /ORGANISM="Karlodinium micrum, Strain CCMP2283" /LENGTH=208 /DNA_ID=CAMNT_0009176197 /DNA_START=42 /DNA_END=668 /DNA_ORIENTATION=-
MDSEDPFSEYLAPDQPVAPPANDAGLQLRLLVESSKRQEQLFVKVCGLLEGLGEKMSAVASNQESLQSTMQRLADEGGGGRASGRGSMAKPPGVGTLGPGGVSREEQQRLEAERLAAERARIEEENKRRAEELARKKAEAEKRAAEEAERKRIEEEKRAAEEKARKQLLESKTTGLMSDLISDSGGGGLFGDDLGKPKKKGGGLFDDD